MPYFVFCLCNNFEITVDEYLNFVWIKYLRISLQTKIVSWEVWMCDVVTGAESSREPLDSDGSLILHQPDYIGGQSFSL